MKEDIDIIVNAELNPCEFKTVEDFIDAACEMLTYRYFEDSKISDNDSENLFPAFINLFGEYLTKVYNKRCGKELSESKNTTIPKSIRRRLSFENMKQEVENLVDYELNPCEFDNVGDFVTETCDILSYNYMVGLDISSKDIDKFYLFLVDTFGEYLVKMYKQRCVEPLKESVKKIIITESQYLRLLSENTNLDNKLINNMKKATNKHIEDFVAENKTILQKSSNILDTNSIISQFKNYLISQMPSLLQQMKTGKGGDVFASNAYKSLYSIIQSNLNNIGWTKRQLVKTISPSKDELLNQMRSSDVDEYFYEFKNLLDLSFMIGWMDEAKPYSDNFNKWSDGLYRWVDTHRKRIKENIINLIINTVYK
jgi:hypothetical protein